MGLKLDKLKKNPVQFLSLTGFSSEEFDELVTEFRMGSIFQSFHLRRETTATKGSSSQDQCFTWIPG